MSKFFRIAAVVALLSCTMVALADEGAATEKAPAPKEIIEKKSPAVDLSEFRTVATAIQIKIAKSVPKAAAQPGYLGVQLDSAEKGKFVIGFVEPESPAEKANLQKGDIIQRVDGHSPFDSIQFRELLQAKAPGETVKLAILRGGKAAEVMATMAATSRPMPLMNSRADLGIRASEEEDGLRVDRVFPSSPAQTAGLKTGDLILKVDQTLIHAGLRISDVIAEKTAGDTVILRIRRDSKEIDLSVKIPKVELDTART
ncbi:MAG TPA: PDZ domain-containing protein, partial [Gemmataceae bacterium]|nr:PDZ domain-containing protein [Gemmataceae bacterium]